MSEQTDLTAEMVEETGPSSQHVILFALEEIAGSFRQATFDVLNSILGEQGYTVAPVHISRFCLRSSPEEYLDDLLASLNAGRLSGEKLVEDVKNGIALQLSSQTATLPSHIGALLDATRGDGIPISAITALSQPTAESLMDTFKLNERGVTIHHVSGENANNFPRADDWLRTARQVDKAPMNCGVICTGQVAAKSAVVAGMRCLAFPDQYTAFEDFSGANAVYDDTESLDAEDALRALCPHLEAD